MREESFAELLIAKIEKEKYSVSPLNKWWIIAPTLSVVLLAIFFKKNGSA
jgi:hypothetical protein